MADARPSGDDHSVSEPSSSSSQQEPAGEPQAASQRAPHPALRIRGDLQRDFAFPRPQYSPPSPFAPDQPSDAPIPPPSGHHDTTFLSFLAEHYGSSNAFEGQYAVETDSAPATVPAGVRPSDATFNPPEDPRSPASERSYGSAPAALPTQPVDAPEPLTEENLAGFSVLARVTSHSEDYGNTSGVFNAGVIPSGGVPTPEPRAPTADSAAPATASAASIAGVVPIERADTIGREQAHVLPRFSLGHRRSKKVARLQIIPENERAEIEATYWDLRRDGLTHKQALQLATGASTPALTPGRLPPISERTDEASSVDMRSENAGGGNLSGCRAADTGSPAVAESPVVAESSIMAEARARREALEAIELAEVQAAIEAVTVAQAAAGESSATTSGEDSPDGEDGHDGSKKKEKKKKKRNRRSTGKGKGKAKGKLSATAMSTPQTNDPSSSSSSSDTEPLTPNPRSPPVPANRAPAPLGVPLPPGTNPKQEAVMRHFLTRDPSFRERYAGMARAVAVSLELVRRGARTVNYAPVLQQVYWVERYLYTKV
jgi:hypothetical protein